MDTHYSKASLSAIADGDQDFMSIVAQTFLEEIPPDLEGLTKAIKSNNKELAYQFAHKMKPNIEMFGIDLMKNISSVETWSRSSKDPESIAPLVEELDHTLRAVFEAIKSDFNL